MGEAGVSRGFFWGGRGGGWQQKAVILVSVLIWTRKITEEGNTRLVGLNILVLKLAADGKEKMLSVVWLYSNASICVSSQDAAV